MSRCPIPTTKIPFGLTAPLVAIQKMPLRVQRASELGVRTRLAPSLLTKRKQVSHMSKEDVMQKIIFGAVGFSLSLVMGCHSCQTPKGYMLVPVGPHGRPPVEIGAPIPFVQPLPPSANVPPAIEGILPAPRRVTPSSVTPLVPTIRPEYTA